MKRCTLSDSQFVIHTVHAVRDHAQEATIAVTRLIVAVIDTGHIRIHSNPIVMKLSHTRPAHLHEMCNPGAH